MSEQWSLLEEEGVCDLMGACRRAPGKAGKVPDPGGSFKGGLPYNDSLSSNLFSDTFYACILVYNKKGLVFENQT